MKELSEAMDVRGTFHELCSNEEGGMDFLSQDGDAVDEIERLDAYCDIQYILNGGIIEAGLYRVFDENFKLVHTNNMGKSHGSARHAQITAENLELKDYDVTYVKDNYVLRNADGKVIKPHNFRKVKLNLKKQ